jgi:hypothetical protein
MSSANFLPKSLHTVRILTAVAQRERALGAVRGDAVAEILNAARVIGYRDASPRDPLIVKAASQLAAGK